MFYDDYLFQNLHLLYPILSSGVLRRFSIEGICKLKPKMIIIVKHSMQE